ncbi:MAG: NADPH:quinone reductase [Gammaproteobacteria bacterium]|jgi:NADPH2:quinone reductase|nr:NADPH:quinone reductase [Gammaproteobacteria bacterium]MBT5216741.1 NADPH:quinone reductase [Gammaproteobacteria bacterium]MBT5542690.1 NADPH:quinone reductase [Gammaproteobacteria bacterium]MBT7753354.1 NADPH:quinone reductase [Gammaproteobacteria bacterium]
MKAGWYENIGSAEEVIQYGEMDDPVIKPGEVLVAVKSSGVNPSDVKTRAGARGELQFPRIIPHSDGGGVIQDVGDGVDTSRIGERVWLWNAAFGRAFGSCAELISLPTEQAVLLPEQTSFDAAACLGVPASTAYYGVFSDGSVDGQTILVTGGAGAVGHYAIQLAKWGGATVISTVSGDNKASVAQDAGSDLVINYKNDDVASIVNDFTSGQGVQRIVEVEFGGNLEISQNILSPNAVIAAYGSVAEGNPAIPFYDLMFKGTTLNTFLIYIVSLQARSNIVNGITKALNDNALHHQIAQRFGLNELVAAHQAVESGSTIGNTIITID